MGGYLYVYADLARYGVIDNDALAAATERHLVQVRPPREVLRGDPVGALGEQSHVAGVVLQLARGFLDGAQLAFAERVLKSNRRLWVYWPAERAVEHIDDERLRSFSRHRRAIIALERIGNPIHRLIKTRHRLGPGLRWIYRGRFPVQRLGLLDKLQAWADRTLPIPLGELSVTTGGRPYVPAAGVYLRTDFWSPMTSGGSYGHTCYVARELAATSGSLLCMLPHRYPLLDELGVRQMVMEAPESTGDEDAIVNATPHYRPMVESVCQALAPGYIYERLCLGNYTGALVSSTLKIPYFVEYNGSEISMQRSFDGTTPFYTDIYLKAEEFAFRQATVISVVSDIVKAELVSRGVDATKILVNPNGVAPDVYAPGTPDERRSIRESLGFGDADRVIGFSGTFGGWHGVDVLAEAMPRIAATNPSAKFLLIGDGKYKPQVDEAIAAHRLDGRVRSVGRVPQQEGARLLKACDIFVSPHSSHMIDSRFFGSPTKLFEYMAMAGGIVASDLEQIGDVLSPALRPGDVADWSGATVGAARAVLCEPGNVDEFVTAVSALVDRPDICAALGANARQAAVGEYSWAQHMDRLWAFASARTTVSRSTIATGDEYKDQVQQQWNNNPVGTQHARTTQPRSLEWFKEIEAHRYGTYAPWMPEVMEFSRHAGKDVLEIGAGVGTDLSQFAQHGARVTDLDLSAGHLALARENFRLRGLTGTFVHHDAETLPFPDASFDLVYSNGVLHHTPNTAQVVGEIRRVLRPGGRVIVMMYAENSLHYWRNLVWMLGLQDGALMTRSMADIMSRTVELTANDARPLVKVYTPERLRRLFKTFSDIELVQRQMLRDELPRWLRPFHGVIEKRLGWNLIIKARKP
jgi:glycosyltransferase involved in cell wall biosynthesis/ubiquinone/menaquinone biosynthesis C-methylase UbiE